MTERNADGKFGLKKRPGRPFQKGRTKTGGRKLGVGNKITRDVKEFLSELVADPEVQTGVRARIIGGDAVAFFRALDQVIGKPMERSNVTLTGEAGQPIRVEVYWRGKAS